MGNCVWWFLGNYGCKGGLQTIGLLYKQWVFTAVIVVVQYILFVVQQSGNVSFQVKSLSYFTDAVAYSRAFYGQGTGSIWLDNVQCTGTESRLFDCPANSVGSHNCGHSEDASASCQVQCKWLAKIPKIISNVIWPITIEMISSPQTGKWEWYVVMSVWRAYIPNICNQKILSA